MCYNVLGQRSMPENRKFKNCETNSYLITRSTVRSRLLL